ncbi:hypothetical protein R3P38DRAFT_2794155 [Favolaschia claudopus]|uniref:Uncharacterized protein n=1 Tax=Favolaschia claudopus TaxID=2862362 RepID=A0AAW0AB40_9AGAR
MNKISQADHERTFRRNAEVENGMLRMESWDGVDEAQTSKSTTHTRAARAGVRWSMTAATHEDGGSVGRFGDQDERKSCIQRIVILGTCTDQERTQFPSTAQATPRTNKYFAVAVVSGAQCRSEKATCYSWCSRTAAQWRLAASTQVHSTQDAAQQCDIVAVGSDGAGGSERASNEGVGEPTSKRCRAVMRARRQKSGGGSGEAAGGRYKGAPSAEGPQALGDLKEKEEVDRHETKQCIGKDVLRREKKSKELSGSDAEICLETIEIMDQRKLAQEPFSVIDVDDAGNAVSAPTPWNSQASVTRDMRRWHHEYWQRPTLAPSASDDVALLIFSLLAPTDVMDSSRMLVIGALHASSRGMACYANVCPPSSPVRTAIVVHHRPRNHHHHLFSRTGTTAGVVDEVGEREREALRFFRIDVTTLPQHPGEQKEREAQSLTTRHTAADASPSSLSLLYPFGTYPASPPPTRRFRQLTRPHITSNAPLSARKTRRLTPNSFPHLHLQPPTLRRRTYSRRTFLLPLHATPFPPSRPSPLSPSPMLYSHPLIPHLSDDATVRDADADAYIIATEKESQAALAAAPTDPNPATPPTAAYTRSCRRMLVSPPFRPFTPLHFHSQLHLQSRPRAPVPAPSTPSTTLSALHAPTNSKLRWKSNVLLAIAKKLLQNKAGKLRPY